MFVRLLLAFSLIPLIELALLIKVGSYVGVLPTIVLVGGTGIAGAYLARTQGFKLLREVQTNLQEGQIPADHLIEGLLVLIGAILLLTPGLITDTTGFLLIIPATRKLIARFAKKKFRQWIEKGQVHVSYGEYRNPRQSSERAEHSFGQHHTGAEHQQTTGNASIDVDFEDIRE